MLDQRGFVAETNATHLFLVTGGRLGHPGGAGLPGGDHPGGGAGPRRGAPAWPATSGDFSLTHFYAADEVFVTGTMGGLVPVIAIDGRTIGDGSPGPVTRRLTGLFAGRLPARYTLV